MDQIPYLLSSYPSKLSAPPSLLPTASPSLDPTGFAQDPVGYGKPHLTSTGLDMIAQVASGSGVGGGASGSAGGAREGSMSEGGGSPISEDKKPAKVPAKRGRKKKEDPVNLDDDLEQKRKVQNRAAQRAFRERKENHVKELEDKVAEQDRMLSNYRDIIERLHVENQALRRGEQVAPTEFTLSPPPSHQNTISPPPPPAPIPAPVMTKPTSPPPVTNVLPPPPPSNIDPSISNASNPTPFSLPIPAPPIDPALSQIQPNLDFTNNAQFDFDFDAPFDFTDSVPLPPLFQDLFDTYSASLGPNPVGGSAVENGTAAAASEDHQMSEADDYCPGDEELDDEMALPNGRLPCDKPECDFSVVSCALPIPWRPPALPRETREKDTWVCKQAWAKLCSHPLFGECDVDELCHELRNFTRCSDDGRLVISKSDVCDVFRTIPARARARREQRETITSGSLV
ncbi:bZIP transcription factor (AP-1) [Pseudohyphozyma bogoriensis]|nr:bZIP transcription factor (AP-1) [Pseudohyphozyma bogoriensis]